MPPETIAMNFAWAFLLCAALIIRTTRDTSAGAGTSAECKIPNGSGNSWRNAISHLASVIVPGDRTFYGQRADSEEMRNMLFPASHLAAASYCEKDEVLLNWSCPVCPGYIMFTQYVLRRSRALTTLDFFFLLFFCERGSA